MDAKEPACKTCARWRVYPCIIRRERTEAWRCTSAMVNAGKRLECPQYLREVGSEAW